MSEITDWEPEMKPETNWQELYALQLRITEALIIENSSLVEQINEIKKRYDDAKTMMREAANSLQASQNSYSSYKESSEQKFRCLKAEIITSLRAINLCLLASINTEKQQLTHRARNFRMRHVNQIISTEIDRFCDRKLTSYEDEF